MRPLSIRARLTAGYLGVLALATLTLAAGAWWLFSASVVRAADEALAARIDGTRHFIEAIQRELPTEELHDEFREFADLTGGDALLEVLDETGRVLCRPAITGWAEMTPPLSTATALQVVARTVGHQPYRALATDVEVGGHRYRITAALPMGTEYAALSRFGWLLAGLVPTVMALAGLGGFWLSGRALSPVDRMTRDARLISLRHLDRRVDVPPADDELRRLAVTFNDMLTRLQRAFDDMVRFTADASHELRTPVSLARTTAELALGRPRTADEYRDALTVVLAQTERMTTLVGDLLVLARADAGVEEPDSSLVDLRPTIEDAIRDVSVLARQQRLDLQRDRPDTPVLIRGSRESLRRLAVILIDNAIKYTPCGGAIRIRLAIDAETPAAGLAVLLEVINSGPGIPADERHRVFDRFYRGAHARQLAPDGSGLGLSIAQTIVERHSGTIDITDGPNGRGCLVRVRLPASETAGCDQQIAIGA